MAIIPPLIKLKIVTTFIAQGHWGRGIRMACDDWMTIKIPEASGKNAIVSPLIKMKNIAFYIGQGHWGRGIRMACDDWVAMRIPEAPTGASGKNSR